MKWTKSPQGDRMCHDAAGKWVGWCVFCREKQIWHALTAESRWLGKSKQLKKAKQMVENLK